MSDELVLTAFGLTAIIGPMVYVAGSFVNGRSHLCTTYNAIWAGFVPFVGFSSLAFANEAGIMQLPHARYPSADIYRLIATIALFVVCFIASYHRSRPSPRVSRWALRMPRETPVSRSLMGWAGLVFCGICLLPRLDFNVPILTEILVQLLSPAIIFTSLFAFASWWKDRENPLTLASFILIFLVCLVLAVLTGGGRRAMLGVLLSVGVFAYWANHRSLDRTKIAAIGGVFVFTAFVFMLGYNQVRHFDRGSKAKGRTVANAIEALGKMPSRLLTTEIFDKKVLNDIGQDTTNVSLYSIHLSKRLKRANRFTGLHYPSYFHNVLYVASNPVPRRFWKDKPVGLGFMLPKQVNSGTPVNWGPGLVGHVYHEGGMWMAIFYGVLIGYLCRTMDDLVIAAPENLFLLAFMASVFPHLIMFIRGDVGLVLLNIVFSLVVFFVLRFAAMKAFGTDPASIHERSAVAYGYERLRR